MGGHSSSPKPTTVTSQTDTPSVDVAQVAAEKALAAQGNVKASTTADTTANASATKLGDAAPAPRRKSASSNAAAANAASAGAMSSSSVLTG